jgi:hypothetical protein
MEWRLQMVMFVYRYGSWSYRLTAIAGISLAAAASAGVVYAAQPDCQSASIVRVYVGRDQYWIPARYKPVFSPEDGEKRVHSIYVNSGHMSTKKYCQGAIDAPWHVSSVSVAIRNITGKEDLRRSSGSIFDLVEVGLNTYHHPLRYSAAEWKEASGPYLVGRGQGQFLSKQSIFLGAKLQIISTRGFAAFMQAPVGRDTMASGTAALASEQQIPLAGTISAFANLISEWTHQSK